MKPEHFKNWNEALARVAEAEKTWKAGSLQEAADAATMALILACIAVRDIAKELDVPGLSTIASNAYLEAWEKREKHHTPKKLMDWARTTFKRLHSELPPDTFPPPRV